MFEDGAAVVYSGPEHDGLEVGDRGQVLHAVKGGCHVLLRTGARARDVVFIPDTMVVSTAPQQHQASVWDDSLSDGTLCTFAAREIFDEQGTMGVLATMDRDGHLSSLDQRAQEAIDRFIAQVRDDPMVREVTAQLDADEAEAFIETTANTLLREASRRS